MPDTTILVILYRFAKPRSLTTISAIAGLKPVVIEDNITYRLRFGVYPDENGENKWLAGYLSEKPYNQYLTIGEGKTLFQAAFHLKRLLKIKD